MGALTCKCGAASSCISSSLAYLLPTPTPTDDSSSRTSRLRATASAVGARPLVVMTDELMRSKSCRNCCSLPSRSISRNTSASTCASCSEYISSKQSNMRCTASMPASSSAHSSGAPAMGTANRKFDINWIYLGIYVPS